MTLKKRFLFVLICYFFTSFLSGSNKTSQPGTGDGLSLLDPLYGTGDVLKIGYTDMKSICALSSSHTQPFVLGVTWLFCSYGVSCSLKIHCYDPYPVLGQYR